ncbi:MAG: glycine betaine ABC transporter substrate-binding protein [Pseudomonadota bacterium]
MTNKLIAGCLGVSLCAVTVVPAQADTTISIGQPSWQHAQIIAHVLGNIIEDEFGLSVDYVTGSTAVIFAAMDRGDGEIDVHPDLWIPAAAGIATEYVEDKKTVLVAEGPTSVSRIGYCIPQYVADEFGISSLDQLADPTVAQLFDTDGDGKGEIWIGSNGWTTTLVEQVRARDYGFDQTFELLVMEEEIAWQRVNAAAVRQEPVVTNCNTPHWGFLAYDLLFLDEPPHDDECFRSVTPNDASDWFEQSRIDCAWEEGSTRLAYTTTLEDRAPDVVRLFENFKPGADLISAWLLELQQGKAVEDLAAEWVRDNRDTVNQWLN